MYESDSIRAPSSVSGSIIGADSHALHEEIELYPLYNRMRGKHTLHTKIKRGCPNTLPPPIHIGKSPWTSTARRLCWSKTSAAHATGHLPLFHLMCSSRPAWSNLPQPTLAHLHSPQVFHTMGSQPQWVNQSIPLTPPLPPWKPLSLAHENKNEKNTKKGVIFYKLSCIYSIKYRTAWPSMLLGIMWQPNRQSQYRRPVPHVWARDTGAQSWRSETMRGLVVWNSIDTIDTLSIPFDIVEYRYLGYRYLVLSLE